MLEPLTTGVVKLVSPDETTLSRASSARALAKLVPPDASIAASDALLPLFSSRENLYALHYQFLGVTQFALSPYAVPTDTRFVAADGADLINYENRFLTTDWTKDHYAGGYARLRSVAGQPTYWRDGFLLFDRLGTKPTGLSVQPTDTIFADGLLLIGASATIEADESGRQNLRLDTVWAAENKVKEDWLMRLIVRDADNKTVFDRAYPFANGLVASSELAPSSPAIAGEIIQPLPRLAPGKYLPVISLERQTAHLELDALGTSQRIVTESKNGGEFVLPAFDAH